MTFLDTYFSSFLKKIGLVSLEGLVVYKIGDTY